jgi:hypothetical protein
MVASLDVNVYEHDLRRHVVDMVRYIYVMLGARLQS